MRFPSFTKEWHKCELSSIFKKSSIKNKDGKITNVISNSAKNGLIPQTDYFDKEIANSENTAGYYIINKGDFVYNPRKSTEAPFGPISVYDYENTGIVSPLYLCFKPQHEISTTFFKWMFKSPVWHRYIYMSGDSGARHDRVSMRDEVFFSMPLSIPEEAEQIKIADFLSHIEKRIEKQQVLVDNLKLYKRGVSEAIFSKKINFGCSNASWNFYTMEDLGSFYNGLSGKGKDDFGKGNSEFITYMNVYKNPISEITMCEVVNVSENEKQNKVQYGDVLFSQSSETLEEVGMSSVWLHKTTPYLNSFCFGFRFHNPENIYPLYIAYYMRSQEIRRGIMREGQGATRINLSAERMKGLQLALPAIELQKKIGDFLFGLDIQINKAEAILNETLELRKSLLQKMFI